MNIKKMLASTLAVITMASSATALTSHAEDFTEVAEVEEMTLSALVAEQLEEKEIAGEISAEDVATTIRVAEQVEEMRNQNMISDEDVLEWEQFLVGNNDMNAIATYASNESYYTSYNYYEKSRLSGSKHYLAIINNSNISAAKSFNVTYYLHNKISLGYRVSTNYRCVNGLRSFIPELSSSTSADTIPITKTWEVISDIPAYAGCMRYRISQDAIIDCSNIRSEYALHCYTSNNVNNPSDTIYVELGNTYGLVKCVYALGDVDRNGFVEPKDTLDVMKNINGLFEKNATNSIRGANSYDEAAFNLAADVDLNGVVNMTDIEEMNKFIMGQSSILR
ncbi:MAG: hypothetical protein K2J25_02470 [Oscillospiraceae bacterium]|nr:hypothetical protein [Oscillospiraceae bacterium]